MRKVLQELGNSMRVWATRAETNMLYVPRRRPLYNLTGFIHQLAKGCQSLKSYVLPNCYQDLS